MLGKGGCTNCYDFEVSDEDFIISDQMGKFYIVKKTNYKIIKDIT